MIGFVHLLLYIGIKIARSQDLVWASQMSHQTVKDSKKSSFNY